jgi:drug/metabolite transporter (DMT)-like permease
MQPGPARSNLRGIIAMCAGMFLFVINDALVKFASQTWPVHQIIAIRGFLASCLIATILSYRRELSGLPAMRNPVALGRCFIEGLVAFAFISALASLPIADAMAIILLSPLLITVAGAIWFGETVRWRRWMAVIAGCAGMLLVIRPGGASFSLAGGLALLATFGIAARDLLTKRVPAHIPSQVIALGTTIASMLTGFAISLFLPWQAWSLPAFLACIGAAFTVAAGNYAVIIAFRDSEVSVVSLYRYTSILWAVIAGYLVFGDVPTVLSLLGIALIVASGLYTLHREREIRLEQQRTAT